MAWLGLARASLACICLALHIAGWGRATEWGSRERASGERDLLSSRPLLLPMVFDGVKSSRGMIRRSHDRCLLKDAILVREAKVGDGLT